jgi:diketogulonate reductase-like aldo/keto reductase
MLHKLAPLSSRIVLGTDKISGPACIDYIHRGLSAGYRTIDTAQVYNNEAEIGEAVRSSTVPRNHVFVTTKISSGFKKNPRTFKQAVELARTSIERLGLDYVDLFLIHHPGDDADPSAAESRRATWAALESLREEGCVRDVGVSNFSAGHILEMGPYARVLPSVNQIEVRDFDMFILLVLLADWNVKVHPWCQQRKLVRLCRGHKIRIQAYAAIARNTHSEHTGLQGLAGKYGVSTAQLLLLWSLQKGYMPIVKMTSAAHLRANMELDSLVISKQDMAVLDSWDKGSKGSLCMLLSSCFYLSTNHDSSMADERNRNIAKS